MPPEIQRTPRCDRASCERDDCCLLYECSSCRRSSRAIGRGDAIGVQGMSATISSERPDTDMIIHYGTIGARE